jgi:hypothetical protein
VPAGAMLIILTFVTTNFSEWRDKRGSGFVEPRVGLQFGEFVARENRGMLAAIDADTGRIVFSRVLDTPSGFSLDTERLYVNSMYGNRVMVLDENLDIIGSLSTSLMSDMHSLAISPLGLLVTCSGSDAIIEVSTDGELLWDWLATENGFDRTPDGNARQVQRDVDHRSSPVETHLQTTHCNSAVPDPCGAAEFVVASLFHQGQVLQIDRATGTAKVVVRDLSCPHNLRRHSDGWVISNSRSNIVDFFDNKFLRTSFILSDFKWVQDALLIDSNRVLIGDANNCRLIIWDIRRYRATRIIGYPTSWKLYQLEIATTSWEERFRSAGGRKPHRV